MIENMKKILNETFQYCLESERMEVMNRKMQIIQFVSIVNFRAMRLMKNNSGTEFQCCLESKTIEAMSLQVEMIQFVLIPNVTQRK
jgi:hypothetical protein